MPEESDVAKVDDGDPADPYYYGWRYACETSVDGTEKMVQVPLTYADLLDPQEDDFIAESTIHYELIHDLNDILRHRYRGQPAVAVWSNLKIWFVIPGLTTGPQTGGCTCGRRDSSSAPARTAGAFTSGTPRPASD